VERTQADSLWETSEGDEPLLATAVHDGHALRPEVAEGLALGEADRLREEDPYSGAWTRLALNRIVPRHSRFQVDLNRPREKAVYVRPEDAWGLSIWKEAPPPALIARSLAEYDAFYAEVHRILTRLGNDFGHFVVLDLHTYNHCRSGPGSPPEDPEANPQVNVGTASVDRAIWGPLVDRFMEDLRAFDFPGSALDVRENVRFQGGNFPRWVNATFPGSGCALAIEFKKFFMDEWTGEINAGIYNAILPALRATIPGLKESLDRL
jgi:N-formylglutamate deformylase